MIVLVLKSLQSHRMCPSSGSWALGWNDSGYSELATKILVLLVSWGWCRDEPELLKFVRSCRTKLIIEFGLFSGLAYCPVILSLDLIRHVYHFPARDTESNLRLGLFQVWDQD